MFSAPTEEYRPPPRLFAVTRARRAVGRRGLYSLVGNTLAGKCVNTLRDIVRRWSGVRTARRLAVRDSVPEHAAGETAGRTGAVYLVPAGPGNWEELVDTIESIRAYEGDTASIVVLDDFTLDCRTPRIQARFPDVGVIRARVPVINNRMSPSRLRAFEIVLSNYDFDVLIQIDIDALVIGPGLSRAAAVAFENDRSAGMLGTLYDSYWHRPEMIHESRWSLRMRKLAHTPMRLGYNPLLVSHGGVYAISRRALDAARANGLLTFRQPWWSRLTEDVVFAMLLAQVDYRPRQWDAIACTSMKLPASLDELATGSALAIHSVRAGTSGESEAEVRAFFRARRKTHAR
jgi:hypothetical protein